MGIKLVAIDLDGTLLNEEKNITPFTAAAVESAMNNGLEVVISTGRCYMEFVHLLEQLPSIRYAVASTGASVIDCFTKKEIFTNGLKATDVQTAYGMLKDFDMLFEVFHQGNILVDDNKTEKMDYYMENTQNPAPANTRTGMANYAQWIEEMDTEATKIHMYFNAEAERDEAWEAIKDMPWSICTSEAYDLEIMATGVDKGYGLQKIAKYLGVKKEEIMAIGDSYNDRAMLEFAGVSVVMANGVAELKQKADIIADSNENDGAGQLLNDLVAGEFTSRKILRVHMS